MQIQLIRHATLQIQYAGRTLLVDPMLGSPGAMAPVPDTPDTRANPLVPLPVPVETLLEPDAVLLTHMHRDHWDEAAERLLPRHIPIFCQPEDEERLTAQGFRHVQSVTAPVAWAGIRIVRTGGRHGRGLLGRSLGPVSGYVLEPETAGEEPTLYAAGDTVWCREVRALLERFRPDVTVVYAGAAKFRSGGAVTMAGRDIAALCKASVNPHMNVIAAHMEAWNHCRLSRRQLLDFVALHDLQHRVSVPADGETLEYRS
ncbi:MBL fold metallo-hydrolase [Paenibacillus chartarius]|uniref:MBL fold metallo-hydrolase n=1 Tax=Paenibacillus chartarius TaxID=747481 RepID=A0ABV6DV08_9BACL